MGHICGDDMDMIDGRPTGSIRVSFGYMSTLEDAQRLLHMIETCFVDKSTLVIYSNDEDLFNPLSSDDNPLSWKTENQTEIDVKKEVTECSPSNNDDRRVIDINKKEISRIALPEPRFEKPDSADSTLSDQRTIFKEISEKKSRRLNGGNDDLDVPFVNVDDCQFQAEVVPLFNEVVHPMRSRCNCSKYNLKKCVGCHICSIALFPIKSCGAFHVSILFF